MTKVLCVTIQYPPHHLGGYEVSCRDVMSRLVARGHQVTVLTSDFRLAGVEDPPDERDGRTPDGVAVRRDLRLYFRDDQLWSPSVLTRLSVERTNQAALRQALDAAQPEVVSVWHLGAVSLGIVSTLVESGLPLVYGISDDWLTYSPVLDAWSRGFRQRPKMAAIVKALCRVPTRVPDLGRSGSFCFISEFTRQRAEEFTPWTFGDSTVVYSGIDRTLYPPPPDLAAAADAAADRPWRGRLLYVGRYDPRKGIETLLAAMPLLPDMTLEVQGKGDEGYRRRLEQQVADLGIADRVVFGSARREELADRYRDADAVVFPSEWDEPFGLVPAEAMSCGTPVAATGQGGSAEFLFDGINCVRFEAGNVADLAAVSKRHPSCDGAWCRAGLSLPPTSTSST